MKLSTAIINLLILVFVSAGSCSSYENPDVTPRWSFKSKEKWVPYDSESNAEIEAAFLNRKPSVEVTNGPRASNELEQYRYSVNFDKMTQKSTGGCVRDIKRVTAQWSFKNPKGWVPIESESNAEIEVAFLNRKQSVEVTKGFYGKRP
eukprot:622734_1